MPGGLVLSRTCGHVRRCRQRLNLTKYRAYDPVAGRWLSRDPLGPAGNLYVYVDGNPVSIVDPMGLCGQSWQDFLQGIIGNPVLLATIVGTEIVGGGPEGPIADAAVVAEIEAVEETGAIANAAPDFVVSPNGTVFPVPKGATGPTPVINSAGNQTGSAFTGGRGGANGQVDTIRLMDPTPPRGSSPGYSGGYVKYENALGQGVNPYTGRTLLNSQSHFPY